MLGKAASEANQILDKVDNFKYFALLGTFVMMLDSALIYIHNTSLLTMSWNEIDSKITIGETLAFTCFFSLYITFIVTTIRISISSIVYVLPIKVRTFFNSDTSSAQSKRDCIHICRLESLAVRTNNSTAYEIVKTRRQDIDSHFQLERYCLAFLVASIVNWLTSSQEAQSLFSVMSFVSDMNDTSPIETTKILFGSLLYIGIFKIGVLDGCGVIYDNSDRDYVYLPKDHELS